MDEEQQLKNRLTELSERSYSRGCYCFSDFLTLAQQNILLTTVPNNRFSLFGGYEHAERRIACFGSEEICGYEQAPPIVCIEIKPVSQRFADTLAHRDLLGALMALGIKRETLGDIIIHNNRGYVFCLETVARFITENLTETRHTTVTCCQVDSPPVDSIALPVESEVVAASERCDALVSAVWGLSRSESAGLFEQKLVFIDGAQCKSPSKPIQSGNIVSVRGKGRFIFCGVKLVTKKGRLRATVRIFK